MTKTWRRRGKSETILISVQNNLLRTYNYIEAKIDNTQQNRKCRLCGNRDKSIDRIIRELHQTDTKRI